MHPKIDQELVNNNNGLTLEYVKTQPRNCTNTNGRIQHLFFVIQICTLSLFSQLDLKCLAIV